jgi:hypothetical protein
MTRSIAFLIPHFGPWPPWIDFFIESCRSNRSIDWFIFSDADPPDNRSRNVRHIQLSFADYKQQVSDAVGVIVGAEFPYKLCDIRPALAEVHADLVRGYDFVAFGDVDVIYGDIRAFYDDRTLDSYDLLSSHRDRMSGHFCLMRNTPEMAGAFRQIRGWKDVFSSADYRNFDERAFFNWLSGKGGWLTSRGRRPRCLFREAYSTPGATSDMRWYWKDGQLKNEFYPLHAFMYLHFMSWHSNRWYADQPGVAAGAAAPWTRLPEIVQMDWRRAREHGFMVSPRGIEPIEQREYP